MIGILVDEGVKELLRQLGHEKETLVLTGNRTTRVLSGYAGEISYSFAVPFRDERPLDPVREAEALVKRGCDTFISFGLGTIIKETVGEGNTLLPSDFIDFNTGPLPRAGFPRDVAMRPSFCPNLRETLGAIAHRYEGKVVDEGVVASLDGPFRTTVAEERLLSAMGGEVVTRNVGTYAKVLAARKGCYQPVILLRGLESDDVPQGILENLLAGDLELPHPYSWVRPRLWNLIRTTMSAFQSEYYCNAHGVNPKIVTQM